MQVISVGRGRRITRIEWRIVCDDREFLSNFNPILETICFYTVSIPHRTFVVAHQFLFVLRTLNLPVPKKNGAVAEQTFSTSYSPLCAPFHFVLINYQYELDLFVLRTETRTVRFGLHTDVLTIWSRFADGTKNSLSTVRGPGKVGCGCQSVIDLGQEGRSGYS